MEEHLQSLLIDEDRKHVLTHVSRSKNILRKKESDHNVMISRLSFTWNKHIKRERIQSFNLKNKECQRLFTEMTSNTNILSSIFEKDENLNLCTKKFLKRLNGCIQQCFRKIRITEKTNGEIETLFQRRKLLRNKKDDKSKEELKNVEEELADKCAKDNYEKTVEEISGMKCETGGVHPGKLWKLRKYLCPKSRDPPTAMLDEHGNLVTSPSVIETLALDTYKKRLHNRPMKDSLEHIRTEKKNSARRDLNMLRIKRQNHGLLKTFKEC